MEKDCGRGNERLDAKELAVYHVAKGEGVGRKIPPNFPACGYISFEMRESKKTDL